MVTPNWLQFTGHQPKRKRAELACTICHSKKIRCDLQARTGQGLANCTNCDTAGKECRVRPSKRSHRRLPTTTTATATATATTAPPHPQTSPAQTSPVAAPVDPASAPAVSSREPEWIWGFDAVPASATAVTAPTAPAPSVPSVPAEPASIPPPVPPPPPQATGVGVSPSIPGESPATCRTEDSDAYRADTLSSRYYQQEIHADARNQEQRLLTEQRREQLLPPLPSADLQQSFGETYLEYCFAWCPVLDADALPTDLSQSPLLVNALAIVGSHINPPVISHDGPAAYYERARTLFYNDEEPDVVRALQAVSLFYWWSPRPPSILHRHSSWWWTSVVIRHCQQLGVHLQPSIGPGPASSQHNHPGDHRSHLLRRRIWWTAFARERLTAICQGKPCIIDPADGDIPEPSLEDFPDPRTHEKAEVFIAWVRLCGVIGRIAKYLARPSSSPQSTHNAHNEDNNNEQPFPTHLARELIDWVQSLPPHLQLPIHADRTTAFNRDVHQLHLPYLAVIIMLHLKRPYQPHPEAYPPAILAASCVARIFRDTLARGGTRFLMAITGWYCGMAFIALLQACRADGLAAAANADLDILTLAVDQLRSMWPTANIFHHGFQRLRPTAAGASALLSLSNPVSNLANGAGPTPASGPALGLQGTTHSDGIQDPSGPGTGASAEIEGINWMDYFPFVTAQTSGIAEQLLRPHTDDLFLDEGFPDTMLQLQFQDLFENYNLNDLFM